MQPLRYRLLNIVRLALSVFMAMALAACSTTSGYHHPASLPSGSGGHAKTGNPYTVNGRTYYPLVSANGYDKTGIASWYGWHFHGRLTADGERYDMHAMSAAHTTLPLPTLVRVTNLENGRQVVVRVNDRGPFVKNRLIDLSYAAAKELGFAKKGTTRVRVQALAGIQDRPMLASRSRTPPPAARPSLPHPRPAAVPVAVPVPAPTAVPDPVAVGKPVRETTSNAIPAQPSGALYVQLGAFSSIDNANRLSHSLANDYSDIAVYSSGSGSARLYKVRIGPFRDVHQIEKTVISLQAIGVRDTIVVIE
jgi:rare lipoprotein A